VSPSLPLKGRSFFQVSTVKRQQPDIPDIIEHTIAFWSERTKQEFSREDARQILANVAGFFQVLAEWEQKETDQSRKELKHG
jgi:hypothetical protein